MQSALESSLFRAINNSGAAISIAHSSISERLTSVKYQYFQRIFSHCIKAYKISSVTISKEIVRFDSTIISLSSRLLAVGYNLKGGDADNTTGTTTYFKDNLKVVTNTDGKIITVMYQ
jgi:hypothetical protein